MPIPPTSPAALGLPPAAPMRDQLQRRLRATGPGVALRVVASVAGPWRPLLRCLIEDAATRGGGIMLEPPDGSLLLVGTAEAFARQLAARIDAIGALPPVEQRELPAAIEPVLGWVGGRHEAAVPQRLLLDPAPLDARLAATPPARLLRRRPIFRLGAGPPRKVAERALPDAAALATTLGALADAPELLAHAADRLAAWAIAHPAALATPPELPLLLPLPRFGSPVAAGGGLFVALVPPAALADPAALAVRRAALAALGWGLAIGPIDAATLGLAAPGAFAADLLLLRWSDALATPKIAAALLPVDPRQLVLGGCDAAAALAWGRGRGIARFAGPAAEAAA